MSSIKELMSQRMAQIEIKKGAVTPLKDIVLSDTALSLIDNRLYLNRFRYVQREYGEDIMNQIALMAKRSEVRNKSHYFAKVCSKANINQTVKTVTKYLINRELVKNLRKQYKTIYKGFLFNALRRLSFDHIKNALSMSKDANKVEACFIYNVQKMMLMKKAEAEAKPPDLLFI
jgi:hypothetical protein